MYIFQAHEQLKAVLMTLLEELPSNLPILLLGTSSVPLDKLEEECASIFALRNVYAFLNLLCCSLSMSSIFLKLIVLAIGYPQLR